jgi:hypothetical protein
MPKVIVMLAIVALGSLGTGTPARAATSQQPSAAAQVTPLLVSSTNAPLRVLGSDGLQHLEYDLVFTNVFTAPVTLTAIQVFAPGGSELLRLDGDALVAGTTPLFSGLPSAVVPASGSMATIIDLALAADSAPQQITHRISFQLPTDAPALSLFGSSRTLDGPSLTIDPHAPIVIAPPLRGDGWFTENGCCSAQSVHRQLRVGADGSQLNKVETFAIDWEQLQGGRFFTGDGSLNDQWFCFGADVLSVAPGTVVSVRDGMPEQMPNQPPAGIQQPADYAGNNVVVQIAPAVWATYAHLQPGSIQVQAGDQVTAGQRLGAVGNSGNSLGPHLHFQLSDGPDVATSSSLPFVFNHYTLAGTVDPATLPDIAVPFGEDGADIEVGATGVALQGTPQPQAATYPLFYAVADFP